MKRFRIFAQYLFLCLNLFLTAGITSCGNNDTASDDLSDLPYYGVNVGESKPLPETEGDFYKSVKYDFYEHWVHSEGQKNIYGRIYLSKDFDKEKSYPTIIMSHGFTGSYTFYNPYVFNLVQAGYVCYAFDFCGGATENRSDGDFYQMSVMTEVNDLKCVLYDIKNQDYFKPGEIVLMGESQGGLVTALTAPQVQKDIDGIVLLYPAFNIPQTMRDTYKTRADIPERPVFLGTEAGRIYAEDVYDLDPYAEAAKYEGRVSIYHGDNDGLVDISYSQRAEQEYKNAELITIPNAKHGFSNAIATDLCEDLLQRFAMINFK